MCARGGDTGSGRHIDGSPTANPEARHRGVLRAGIELARLQGNCAMRAAAKINPQAAARRARERRGMPSFVSASWSPTGLAVAWTRWLEQR